MFTRGNRELLNPNPTFGPEEPWTTVNVLADHPDVTYIGVQSNIGSDQVSLQNPSGQYAAWPTSGICRFIDPGGSLQSWTYRTGGLINDGEELPFVKTGSGELTVTLAANATSDVGTTVSGSNALSEVLRELIPSDPTNSLQGTSNLFNESNGDLIFREVADGTSDLHFSQISGEFVPDET